MAITATTALVIIGASTPANAATSTAPTVVSTTLSTDSVDVTSTSGALTVTLGVDDPADVADPVVELHNSVTGVWDDDDAVEMDYVTTNGSTDTYTAEIDVPSTLSLGTWDVVFWPDVDTYENSTVGYSVVGHVDLVKHWTVIGTPSAYLQGLAMTKLYLSFGIRGVKETPANEDIRWYRSGDPAAIVGATSGFYAPTDSDVGHTLHIVVTISKPGYPQLELASTESSVVKAYPVPRVRIGPTAVVGNLTYAETYLSNRTVQWNLDGAPIPGATKSGYTPTAAQGAHRLSVTISWLSSPDGIPVSVTSDAVVILRAFATPRVTLTGSGKVGHRLRAHASGWGVRGVTQRYQWMANGRVIRGQHAATFVPGVRYAHMVITADVKASKAGYLHLWSPPSAGKRVHR